MTGIWEKIKKTHSNSKNLTAIGFGQVVSSIIAGIFWFYIASLLGTEHYGEVSYYIAIAGIASTISFLGAENTIIVYTAKGEKIQSPIFFVSITSSFIASIVLFFILFNMGVSLFVIGYAIFGLATAEILGRKLYKAYSKYLITQKLLMSGLSILLYYLFGPDGVIIGIALSFFPYVSRLYKGFKESKFDFSIIKPRLGFMMNSYALELSRTFSGSTDKLIIAPIFGFTLLGNYQLGIQFLAVLSILPSTVYKYLLPQDASGEPNKRLKKVTILSSVGLAFLGFLLSPVVIPTLFPKFIEAIQVVQIISLAIIPGSVNLVYISKFLGNEKIKIVLASSIIYIIIQVVTIIIMGQLLGINGVAAAYVLSVSSETIFLVIADKITRKLPVF